MPRSSRGSAWYVVACLAMGACHQGGRPSGPPAPRQAAPLPPASEVLKAFADTGEVLPTPTRSYSLRTPGERDSLAAETARHRAAWQAAGVRDYTVLVRVSCFCPGPQGWLLIEVRGSAVSRVWEAPGRRVPVSERTGYTVDRLFELLEEAAARDDVVQVGFDLGWHFPARIRTDTSVELPDDWGTIDVRGLRPRGRAGR